MEQPFTFADDLGPEKIVYIYEPHVGLNAIVVIDNTAAGPAIGGTRMGKDVSAEECFRLARAMTFKNSAAALPHGGAKSVIFGDPSTATSRISTRPAGSLPTVQVGPSSTMPGGSADSSSDAFRPRLREFAPMAV